MKRLLWLAVAAKAEELGSLAAVAETWAANVTVRRRHRTAGVVQGARGWGVQTEPSSGSGAGACVRWVS